MKQIYFFIFSVLIFPKVLASSIPAFDPPTGTFSYPATDICQSSFSMLPTLDGSLGSGGTFSCSPFGLLVNPVTGEINPQQSEAGTYIIVYTLPAQGEEPAEAVSVYITVWPAVQLAPADDVNACVFYILPTLALGNYFSEPYGGGTAYFAGDVLLQSQTMHVYQPSGGICPDADVSFTININAPDITVTLSDGTLTSNQPDAEAYQWAICSDPPITVAGATSQSFTPTTTGPYEVLVTLNGCAQYSYCTDVTDLGVSGSVHQNISFYPNPVKEELFVKNPSDTNIDKAILFDSNGRKIGEYQGFQEKINVSNLETGIYFIQIFSEGAMFYRKIVKQ